MPIMDILVTNILPTGTAFGVLADDHSDSVFIPSRVAMAANLQIGETARALVVPNQTHGDRTPWIVVRVESGAMPTSAPVDVLADMILQDLEEGRSTAFEVSESLDEPYDRITAKLAEMVAGGRIVQLTCYDLPEDAA